MVLHEIGHFPIFSMQIREIIILLILLLFRLLPEEYCVIIAHKLNSSLPSIQSDLLAFSAKISKSYSENDDLEMVGTLS